MAKWARVVSTEIKEISGFDPAGRFPPSVVWVLVPVTIEEFITIEYTYVDEEFVPPSLQNLKNQFKQNVAARRWEEETKGAEFILPDTTVVTIQTTDRSKLLLHGARDKARREIDANPSNATTQHVLDLGTGLPVEVANTVIIDIANAADDHVQLCFDRWGAIVELIDAATTTQGVTDAYYDNIETGWPA